MQTYGIEIESCGLTEAQLKEAIESVEGLEYAGHFGYHGSRVLGLRSRENGTSHVWASERDGSLTNHTGRGMTHEVVTPLLYGVEGLKTASKVMKAMERLGARVNRSCGTHVTVGVGNSYGRFRRFSAARQMQVANNVVDLYCYFYAGFCALVSESRRHGSRTQSGYGGFSEVTQRVERARMGWGTNPQSIYHGISREAVNLRNFISSGIIEFRQHNGTLNGTKISNWANLMHSLLKVSINENHPNYRRDVRDFPPTLTGLLDYLCVGSTLRKALMDRAEELSGWMPTKMNSEWLSRFWNEHIMAATSDAEADQRLAALHYALNG